MWAVNGMNTWETAAGARCLTITYVYLETRSKDGRMQVLVCKERMWSMWTVVTERHIWARWVMHFGVWSLWRERLMIVAGLSRLSPSRFNALWMRTRESGRLETHHNVYEIVCEIATNQDVFFFRSISRLCSLTVITSVLFLTAYGLNWVPCGEDVWFCKSYATPLL